MSLPLNDNALTTYAAMRSDLGDVKDEELICRLINAVSDEFAAEANRILQYEADVVDVVEGTNTLWLWMQRAPILSINQIQKLDEYGTATEVLDAAGYAIDSRPGTGMIYRGLGWAPSGVQSTGLGFVAHNNVGRGRFEVTYTAGWVTPWQADERNDNQLQLARTLPANIEEVVIREVSTAYKTRNRDLTISSYSKTEGDAVTYRDLRKGFLSPAGKAMARRYRLIS